MRPQNLAIWVVSLAYTTPSLAQTSPDPSKCVKNSGVTDFQQCNYLEDTVSKCVYSVAPGAPFVACYCNQALFDSILDCGSEERLCVGNEGIDGYILSDISVWHSICDNKISFTPTTPPLSSITAPYNGDYCTTAFSSCVSVSYELGQCQLSYGSIGSTVLSCLCQPKILSLEYTCEFLGNISCQQMSAALTNMAAYPYCTNLLSVLGPAAASALTTLPVNASSSFSSSLSSSTVQSLVMSSISITQPALPGALSSTTGASTKSSTGVVACVHNLSVVRTYFGIIMVALALVT